MNTDRELLEAAAKAAGLTHLYCAPWRGMAEYNRHLDEFCGPTWNPLTNDGDALGLAVKLGLTVAIKGHECEVFTEDGEYLASVPIMGASCFVNAADATNPAAATRRAIVRAAAALAGVPAVGAA